ncbi:hypothetical protein MLD38_029817 [Melastoma candidum]|uniref:Uncharacterized protein n=1 Tax=Melastoma candidum TaxID=119954 RepID=A0ACB9N6W4_9MYRT|nr:hypothetical protein MLD38_029817 [Melastoma candidum]
MMMMMMMSSSSATVRVEKATSDLLINPDWTLNMNICDYANSYHGQARDILQAVKKRLQHKNPKVQFLTLTLLETMVKNCGDHVHHQIAERNILGEMVKIVKKKTDMQVREKALVLLDHWQEAFGGPGGKYPQYFYTYEELRRSGVAFPQRTPDAAPIFTPPPTHLTLRHDQAGYGMPSNSSLRLDEAMANDTELLSSSAIDSMTSVLEVLSDMMQAVNPNDRESVKDEIIVDLVSQCRSNQKKLMQMLSSTSNEALLAQGLELNDALQSVLARHDAIASGSPQPIEAPNLDPQQSETYGPVLNQGYTGSPTASVIPSAPPSTLGKNFADEEEEEDEFAQLARRHSKVVPTSESSSTGSNTHGGPSNSSVTPSSPTSSASAPSNALVLANPPAPVKISKDQDMIDFLSLALTTTSFSPQSPPSTSTDPGMQQSLVSPGVETSHANPYANIEGQAPMPPNNSYVALWAQPVQQNRPQFQMPQQVPPPQPQFTPAPQPQFAPAPQPKFALAPQTQFAPPVQPHSPAQRQPRVQPQPLPQYPQAPSAYPPPPWATASNYGSGQSHSQSNSMFWNPCANTPSCSSFQDNGTLQQVNSSPASGNNGPSPLTNATGSNPAPATGQKPFIPSYRLFEDLDVFGNAGNGRVRQSGQPPSLTGSSGQSMVGGRK